MKILTVADVESKFFYDFYSPGKLSDFDLIIACGDLKEEYLEFLVTMAECPLLYIHGNHDENHKKIPEGCICIDDELYVYKGVRILGLGGSYRYREGKYMYTDKQMKRRIRRLFPSILRHRGFDILVTHAPARHLNDFDTLPHRGFECFNKLLDRYKPKFFLHGHIHRNYGSSIPQKTEHGKTTVINAYNYCVIEI
ncbi:MAG: metallophosphoesterase family protein [Ruminococcus sp.]|nr:metallophosphoesterase family protein [Ruminococcus sp.]